MDTKSRENGISEAEISMVLDTYMYMNFQSQREGMSIDQMLDQLGTYPDYQEGGIFYGEYKIVKEAAQNPEIGSLMIDCQSRNMGYDSGTAACAFYTPDKSRVFIAYRGTGDGEWLDNGIGMTRAQTPQQTKALAYFEETVEYLDIQPGQRLLVTGHSKGGNKAQFVTMETKYHSLLDACYSVDGQGFSDTAIDRWKRNYDQSQYTDRTSKLHGINGENDYVSVLGTTIIPDSQIKYVKTPAQKNNFAGYHDIKYMFASKEYDKHTQTHTIVFHGRKNTNTLFQGELGKYAGKLSEKVMELKPGQRDGCAAILMQLLEMTGGSWQGINQEKITKEDLADFIFAGIPTIAGSILSTAEGIHFQNAICHKESFDSILGNGINIQICYSNLFLLGEKLIREAQILNTYTEELLQLKERLPRYTNFYIVTEHRMKLSASRFNEIQAKLIHIGRQMQQIAQLYQNWDKEMSQEASDRIVFRTKIS